MYKSPIAILISFTLSGCATPIYYNNHEICAQRGMVLDGVTVSSTSGSTYDFASGRTYVSSYNSEGQICKVPKSEEEKCQVNRLTKEMEPKDSYNSNIKDKRLLTGLGYFLYVVPGVYFKYKYDQQRAEAILESQKILTEDENACRVIDRSTAAEAK